MATRILGIRGAAARWWLSLSPPASDACLYAAAAVFALAMGLGSTETAQWHWGYIAAGPFALAAGASFVMRSSVGSRQRQVRVVLLGLVIVGALALPLGLETGWRSLAQPEVGVIMRSGTNLVTGHHIYTASCNDHGVCGPDIKGLPLYESFFPYFPLMSLFGVLSAITHHQTGLSDARIVMSVFTCFILALALGLLRASPERKIRIAQVLVALPTGSLFLATGGDDMPILSLCLLALVLLQRKRTWAVGFTLGVACAMKLTAWPFALAVLVAGRDREGRRSWRQVATAIGVVVVTTVTPFIIEGPRAFIMNVFAFPLGLASGVHSPAASPLPGHLLTSLWPPLRHVILPAVFAVGAVVLYKYMRERWPLDLPGALRVLAVSMLVVICSATATRIGYLIYPLNFVVWAWAFSPATSSGVEGVVLVEAQRPTG